MCNELDNGVNCDLAGEFPVELICCENCEHWLQPDADLPFPYSAMRTCWEHGNNPQSCGMAVLLCEARFGEHCHYFKPNPQAQALAQEYGMGWEEIYGVKPGQDFPGSL